MAIHDGRNLTYCVAQSLGRAIVSGAYAPGSPPLVEAELARQYGVSRAILREAVKMVTAKGLVGACPSQGILVKPEQGWDVLDPDVLHWLQERGVSYALVRELALLRLAVEPKAVAQAARTATAEQKSAIRATLGRITASERGDDDGVAARIAFHEAILVASGNRFYAPLAAAVEASIRLGARLPLNMKKSFRVRPYVKICGAVLVGDPVAAETAMVALVQAMLDQIDHAERQAQTRVEMRDSLGGRTVRKPDAIAANE